jgi:hypothetical protein
MCKVEVKIPCQEGKPENLRNFLTSAMKKETFSASESSDLIPEISAKERQKSQTI